MRFCVFCGDRASSKEHAWPEWLLKRGRPGRAIEWLRGLDAGKTLIIPNGELRAGAVCTSCNTGWMHRVEEGARRIIAPMHDNLSVTLDEELQQAVAVWAVKTTMVLEAFSKKNHAWFYEPAQRHAMRLTNDIPTRTIVWIGRYLGLETPASYGGPFGPNADVTFGYTMTMTFGALALHVVTLRSDYNVPRVEGWWTGALSQIWPVTRGVVRWPPAVTFTDEGGALPIRVLTTRILRG